MNDFVKIAIGGAIAFAAFGMLAQSHQDFTGRVVVYPLSDSEWGYTIVSGPTFVHAERGFADEKTARDTADAYISANINPKMPAGT